MNSNPVNAVSDSRQHLVRPVLPCLKFMILVCFPFLVWFVFGVCMWLGQLGSDSFSRTIGPQHVIGYLVMAPAIYGGVAANIFIVFSCIRISQFRNYRLAWVTVIVAALPCVNPATVVPAIVLMFYLSKPEVRQAFGDRRGDDALPASDDSDTKASGD